MLAHLKNTLYVGEKKKLDFALMDLRGADGGHGGSWSPWAVIYEPSGLFWLLGHAGPSGVCIKTLVANDRSFCLRVSGGRRSVRTYL